ncbi:DNA-binding response OmpR family regulator [Kitasatospora sp. MAP12-15]|uniref:response regulator n=1 Tax=unclassified Kitasatospora TaxID=2633591 RepID=UPI0024768365|nr:response regulator [Kitasatospora sp. MAP12-44]MDH6114687.1 DNA-binding response OmpR family regulator [Kitasatospora sp. MAP12-44]
MTPDTGRVLVVDDDRTNRMMLTYRLEINGIHATAAENGQQALRLMREETFHVVLLDILMPQMDGYTTLEIMKGDPALCPTPVIVISQLDEMDSVIRCLELGAEDYLPKPLNALLLMARVNGILLRSRLSRIEEDHQRQVARLIEAVTAAENGTFDPPSLDAVAEREDHLGELARALQRTLPSLPR